MKKKEVFGFLGLFVWLFLPYISFASLANSPWPMFMHDAQRTGRSSYVGAQSNQVKWVFEFQQGTSRPPQIPSVGLSGKIYISHYAVNPDGTLAWITPICPFSGVAIAVDGTIYAGYGNGFLYAVNPNGSLKWKFDPQTNIGSGGPFPALGPDGTIYVSFLYYRKPNHLYIKVFALAPDGTLKWSYQPNELVVGELSVAPDGTIYMLAGGSLYAVNPDGTLKWRYDIGFSLSCFTPVISSDGTIYIGTSRGIHTINSDGTLKWKTSLQITAGSDIALGWNDNIYIILSNEKTLYAMDSDDGSIYWSYVFDSRPIYLSVDAQDTVYITTDIPERNIYSINADGSLKWKYFFFATNEVPGYPVIGSGEDILIPVYVEGANGKLYAIGSNVDITPPAAVTELSVKEVAADSITLTWTAPGDDGNQGTAIMYDIRYSTTKMTDEATPEEKATWWNSATQCQNEPKPKRAGSGESFTVSGLSSDTTYYFALKTTDEVPNWSELSNVVGTKTIKLIPADYAIIFSSNRDGNWEIYGMNDDGTGQINLTNNFKFDADPAFAPNGDKIVFSSDRDCSGISIPKLYIMSTDGSNVTLLPVGVSVAPDGSLFIGPDILRTPKFSPDGSKIVFRHSLVPGGHQPMRRFT